jgi:LysM repeat protein
MERDPFADKPEGLSEEVEDEKIEDWEEGDMLNQTRSPQRTKNSQNTPVLFWAALVFIIFAFFFVLIRSWNQVSKDDIKKLNESTAQLDSRLTKIEETSTAGGTDLQVQLNAMAQAIKRLESANQTLQNQVNQLSEKSAKLAKASTPAAPTPAAIAGPETKPPSGKRYYVVQKGDTLFGIAKKYGKRVADIQKSNNLGPKQGIFPGQKLLIE